MNSAPIILRNYLDTGKLPESLDLLSLCDLLALAESQAYPGIAHTIREKLIDFATSYDSALMIINYFQSGKVYDIACRTVNNQFRIIDLPFSRQKSSVEFILDGPTIDFASEPTIKTDESIIDLDALNRAWSNILN